MQAPMATKEPPSWRPRQCAGHDDRNTMKSRWLGSDSMSLILDLSVCLQCQASPLFPIRFAFAGMLIDQQSQQHLYTKGFACHWRRLLPYQSISLTFRLSLLYALKSITVSIGGNAVTLSLSSLWLGSISELMRNNHFGSVIRTFLAAISTMDRLCRIFSVLKSHFIQSYLPG